MANFSTNQVKHLYVATAVDGNLDTLGDIKFSAAGDGQIAAKYVGNDGVVRTDLIDLATLKGKGIKASAMSQYLKSAYVASTSAVAGQQYLLKVILDEFGGMTAEDKGFIFADYTAKSGDAAKNVIAELAVSLAKNASKAAYNQLIKVYVTTVASGQSFTLNTNLWEVTPSSAPSTVAGYGSLVGIVIEAAEQPWYIGRMQTEFLRFSVAADPIVSSGLSTQWATITYDADHPHGKVLNGKKIADLEAFCAGERGDIYRNVGWPNSFEFKPIVNPNATYGYDVIELTWAYQGDAEDIQKSPKELIIAIPAPASYGSSTASYLVTADINTAAGSTVVTQVFGS
jgi:hypothetical protein